MDVGSNVNDKSLSAEAYLARSLFIFYNFLTVS